MKIFQLLSCLSKKELGLVQKAVLSPLFNTNQKVVQLFGCLKPMYPNFGTSPKARQKIFKKLFPDIAYNDYKLRRLFHELTKVIENCLLYIDQENDAFERQTRLTNSYNKRGLDKPFKKNITELLNELVQDSSISTEKSWQHLNLLELQYFHPTYDKYAVNDRTLQLANEQLDLFYILKKYRLTVALKAREQSLQEQYNHAFLEAILPIVEKSSLKNHALIHLFQQVVTMIQSDSVETFTAFETAFFASYTQFSLTDQQFLYFTGVNFLVKAANSAQTQLQSKLIAWYKFGLRTSIIFERDKMIENTFANIIIAGCKANQFVWVEQFMDSYQHKLAVTDLDITLLHYKGIYCYIKEDYDQALALLLSNDKKSVYPLRLRNILIRIIFEKFLLDISYMDVLLANLTAYEYYLKRNKSAAIGKLKAHQNFIKVVRFFARKRLASEEKKKIEDWFVNFIQKDNPLLAKSWLTQKLKQL